MRGLGLLLFAALGLQGEERVPRCLHRRLARGSPRGTLGSSRGVGQSAGKPRRWTQGTCKRELCG